MTLSVLEGYSILYAFSSAIFSICGALQVPCASAVLLVQSCERTNRDISTDILIIVLIKVK